MTTKFEEIYDKSLALMQDEVNSIVSAEGRADMLHNIRNVVINKGYFKGRVERGEHVHICIYCGCLTDANHVQPCGQRLIDNQTCFVCDLWDQRAKNLSPANLIIENHMYSDGGDRPGGDKRDLGFGGRVFRIQRGDRVWTTNNLWHRGFIPERFQERMPNNAVFLPEISSAVEGAIIKINSALIA